jgi:hypothetical protein
MDRALARGLVKADRRTIEKVLSARSGQIGEMIMRVVAPRFKGRRSSRRLTWCCGGTTSAARSAATWSGARSSPVIAVN